MKRKQHVKILILVLLLCTSVSGVVCTFFVQAANTAATESTHWKKEDGCWYYYLDNGKMATGWVEDPEYDDKRFYFDENGIMQTGWFSYEGNMYYLKDSGAMATKWVYIDDQYYYFNEYGHLQIGWHIIDEHLYKLRDDTGAQVKGWIYEDGYWYYLSTYGAVRNDTITLAGYAFTFDEYGHWLANGV